MTNQNQNPSPRFSKEHMDKIQKAKQINREIAQIQADADADERLAKLTPLTKEQRIVWEKNWLLTHPKQK